VFINGKFKRKQLMKKNLYVLGFLIFVYSCRPSIEEIQQREKVINDSIQLVDKQRIHAEKIEVGKSIKRTKLSDYLKNVERQIEKANHDLDDIKVFQIGRLSSTKQRELNEQSKIIQQLEGFKEGLQNEISQTHLSRSYDFQFTPEGTVKQLIISAMKEDYSKLRYLIDPYGEFDQDAFSISLIESYPQEMKIEWRNQFANGRIMGEPRVNLETAEVEIAMGISSDRLQTIQLIKRQDRWYIQSF
jgi:hypothetical protein